MYRCVCLPSRRSLGRRRPGSHRRSVRRGPLNWRAFLHDTWATITALPWARPILATTTLDPTPFGLGDGIELWLQGDDDLGARMQRVVNRALETSPCALVLGADVPGLPGAHLDAALASLAHADVVLGPTADGGFYLLGATRLQTAALTGISWSTSMTRLQTVTQLRATGHLVGKAPPWFDVDEPDDLLRLRSWLTTHPTQAPHTRSVLGL